MSKNEWPKYLYALDISRGVAALAVVLWHWQHFAYKGSFLPQEFAKENQPLYSLLRMFYDNGWMGVQYFFLLSGFIFFWLYNESIKNKKISAWEFFVHRFSRLYPLHFATLIAVAILQLFYISRENTYFVYPFNDAFHFFLNIGFASKWGFESGWSFNAPIWSVSIEVLLYGVFFIVAMLRLGGWLYCLAISVLSAILSFVIHHPIMGGLAMFFLGGLVFHLTSYLSLNYKASKKTIYFITALFWSCTIVNQYIFDIGVNFQKLGMLGELFLTGFPFYILFPLTALSLVLFEIDNGPVLKRLSWIGNITYSSYLLHFPLQLLFGLAVSFGVLSQDFYLNPIYLATYFIILISLSNITFNKFERPMQRAIRAKFAQKKDTKSYAY